MRTARQPPAVLAPHCSCGRRPAGRCGLPRRRRADQRPATKRRSMNSFDKSPSAAALTALGRALFFDPTLSASGKIARVRELPRSRACVLTARPRRQRGGAGNGTRAAGRAVVHVHAEHAAIHRAFLRYRRGRQHRSGARRRAQLGRARAVRARTGAGAAVLTLRNGEFGPRRDRRQGAPRALCGAVSRAFGTAYSSERRAFKAVLLALETFEETPADFYPYTSKYDAYFLRGGAVSAGAARA